MSQSEGHAADVAQLMAQVRAEVRRRRGQLEAGAPGPEALDTSVVLSLLALAESKAATRTALPRILDRFPFNRIRRLEQAVLRVYELVTAEQRAGLAHLGQALREVVELNRRLDARLRELEARLDAERRRSAAARGGTPDGP